MALSYCSIGRDIYFSLKVSDKYSWNSVDNEDIVINKIDRFDAIVYFNDSKRLFNGYYLKV